MEDTQNKHPEKYWHCYIKIKGENRGYLPRRVLNDKTYAEIQNQVILPFQKNRSFVFDGVLIDKKEKIEEIRITYTPNPRVYYVDQYEVELLQKDELSASFGAMQDRNLLPIRRGVDYTNELLYNSETLLKLEADVSLLIKICERIHRSASILAHRTRTGKEPYVIQDEYDVQDLLHAVIKAYIPYLVVREEPLRKVAGSRAGIVDISIGDIGTLIEVKYAREPKDQSKFVDDFNRDLGLYANWQPLQNLIYLIYNAGVLRDPESLKRLEGEKEIDGKRFYTHTADLEFMRYSSSNVQTNF